MIAKSVKDVEVVKVLEDAFSEDLPNLPQMESLSFIDVMWGVSQASIAPHGMTSTKLIERKI